MKTRDSELKFAPTRAWSAPTACGSSPSRGPVAILVDAMSGSATECFAGGMQSIGRARVFGQTSMGQALPALFDKLPNGDVLIHAYGDFVTADGTRLEGRGVVPDEIVPVRREDLLAGRDATLDAALAWIDRTGPGRGAVNPGTNEPSSRVGCAQGGPQAATAVGPALVDRGLERVPPATVTALKLRHLRVLLLRGQERLC